MIAWVAARRRDAHVGADDLRRIELCALTTLDVSMFHDLFGPPRTGRIDHIGGDPHAPAPQVQDER